MSSPRAHCVTYADEFSVGQSAANDLQLGFEKQIVACNSARINKALPGDLVIITAPSKDRRIIMIGRLIERADHLRDTWAKHGGTDWQYCWTIEPLLPPTQVTILVLGEIHRLSEKYGIKSTNILNSRLCPLKATPVLSDLAAILADL